MGVNDRVLDACEIAVISERCPIQEQDDSLLVDGLISELNKDSLVAPASCDHIRHDNSSDNAYRILSAEGLAVYQESKNERTAPISVLFFAQGLWQRFRRFACGLRYTEL